MPLLKTGKNKYSHLKFSSADIFHCKYVNLLKITFLIQNIHDRLKCFHKMELNYTILEVPFNPLNTKVLQTFWWLVRKKAHSETTVGDILVQYSSTNISFWMFKEEGSNHARNIFCKISIPQTLNFLCAHLQAMLCLLQDWALNFSGYFA